MTKWGKTKKLPFQTPTEPCAHCHKQFEQFGWVVNGAGQLCHYPTCFMALWKAASDSQPR